MLQVGPYRAGQRLSFSYVSLAEPQIMCTGIVGEYVGKIYLETKARPRFIIEEKLTDDSKNK